MFSYRFYGVHFAFCSDKIVILWVSDDTWHCHCVTSTIRARVTQENQCLHEMRMWWFTVLQSSRVCSTAMTFLSFTLPYTRKECLCVQTNTHQQTLCWGQMRSHFRGTSFTSIGLSLAQQSELLVALHKRFGTGRILIPVSLKQCKIIGQNR